ncbi:DUF4760 domain-containing protein [Faucicola atlantae]|uniref:DUF4760 domain-containing protein n=1 Tax=Faucicola atlantae TaxID=34059 RepID=UPI0020A25EA7|nr:DUF4760 domain-containing protein [Moraxella atlantae]
MVAIPPTEAPAFLGESWGFWLQTSIYVIQTLIFLVTAVIAFFTLNRSERMARKRATIDLVLAENQDDKFRDIKEKFGMMRLNGDNFTALAMPCTTTEEEATKVHADKKETVITILNQYEFIASAIFEDALDEDLYKRMKKGVVVRDWETLKPFVMELRSRNKRPKIFCEIERLANRWQENPPN